ncbi:hypothetical protein MtrunA17_Chr4g0039001 [Medicago truncatula]|uniref:Uncharacterized protein n=1 Tax=Medicago truncatula TaxID=3880 RepID=A0A396ID58_MEDTR|nr:hypothetical protein MtrunA17_Chr4g0039001 [Medicago truncatula]
MKHHIIYCYLFNLDIIFLWKCHNAFLKIILLTTSLLENEIMHLSNLIINIEPLNILY